VLRSLHETYPHAELVLLSTCNRTELYMARPLHGHPRIEQVIEWLAARAHLPADQLAEHVYHHENETALGHLMAVACGLDSLALGEAQILGQVKQAHAAAQTAGVIGKVLNHAFRDAVAAAKLVRTHTGIGEGKSSVSSVAVDFARHLFHDFSDKTLVVLGAGKMTQLTLTHFLELRPANVLIANRSADRARSIADAFPAAAASTHGLEELDDLLTRADIVISSTAAPQPLVTLERMRPLIRRRRFRPLFIIDIAVPRDFDPAVGQLANLYLYDLDDLQAAIADQSALRNGSVARCRALIDEAVGQTYAAIQTHDFSDLIRKLRDHLHDLGEAETHRTIHKLRAAPPDQMDRLLAEHTERLINKILHRPVSELGRSGGPQAAMFATAIRRLFELEVTAEDLANPESNQPQDSPPGQSPRPCPPDATRSH